MQAPTRVLMSESQREDEDEAGVGVEELEEGGVEGVRFGCTLRNEQA